MLRTASLTKKAVAFIMAAACAGWYSQVSLAQTSSWNGAADTNWGDAGNWASGVPSATLGARFDTMFTNQPTLSVDQSAKGLQLTTGVGQDVTIDGELPCTLTANVATLSGNSNVLIAMDGAAGRNLTLGANITLQPQTGVDTYIRVNNGGTLTFAGTLKGPSTNNIMRCWGPTLGGAGAQQGTVDIAGNITASSGEVRVVSMTTLILENANPDFKPNSMRLAYNGAILRLNDCGAIPSTVRIDMFEGILQLRSDNSETYSAKPVVYGTGNVTYSGINVDQKTSGGMNNTLTLNALTIVTGNGILNVTGGHGYNLGISTLTVGDTGSVGTCYVRPTTANVIIDSVAPYNAAGTNSATLRLEGTSSNNQITGAMTNTGTRPLVLVKDNTSNWTLSGNNTYTGTTTIAGGQMQFAKQNSLYSGNTTIWTATNLVVNAEATAAFNVGGTGEFTSSDIDLLASLGTTSGGFRNGSRIGLDTTNAGGTFTYNTPLTNTNGGANAVGLTKLGTGVLTLTGINTYTGTTIIDAGILRVANTGLINNTASIRVNAGGTLEYQNTATALNKAITNAGGTVIMASGASVVVASGTGYAGYQSTSAGGLGSELNLLDGTAGAANTLTTTWRARSSSETYPTQTYPPLPGGSKGLISDVVDFTGTGSDIYALQISYDPAQIVPGMTESELVSAGLLYLAYNNGGTYANAGTTFVREGAYIPGTDFTLGNWGVDTTNHVAWAVVSHNSEWAVVPEPGTMALLAFGSLAVLNLRRKAKKSA